MNREEIIELAREVELCTWTIPPAERVAKWTRFADLLLERVKPEPLTNEQVVSACLSFRHDFGLMSEEDQASLIFQAREWEKALNKERAHGIK